ncbi:hypothetical protein CROQUDRAFT_87261 [Cronartium quercuum f. sp. fusiforme G11]|uniref:Uncharacterized protein n=1 Tax=Cronartium quercuum f. sp. fusiforme G11 TaxID=708437 RepID=A0A9P6NVU8_9BASI|nr:hypothetical protein CROQUDRAFT_87261 [Cronartium quercuum f. sp. fusiforme G11]
MATGLPDKLESIPFSCADCLLSESQRAQMLGLLGGEQPQPLELMVSNIAGPFNAGMAGIRYSATFRNTGVTHNTLSQAPAN